MFHRTVCRTKVVVFHRTVLVVPASPIFGRMATPETINASSWLAAIIIDSMGEFCTEPA
jgi:hypothetical protein